MRLISVGRITTQEIIMSIITFLGSPHRVITSIIAVLEVFTHMGRYDKVSTLVLIACGFFAGMPLATVTQWCNWLSEKAKGLDQ